MMPVSLSQKARYAKNAENHKRKNPKFDIWFKKWDDKQKRKHSTWRLWPERVALRQWYHKCEMEPVWHQAWSPPEILKGK